MSLGDVIGDLSVGVKSIADTYVQILGAKYSAGLASKQTSIEELKATTSLLAQQNEAQRVAAVKVAQASAQFNPAKYLPYLLLAGGAFFIYKLVK